MAISARHEQTQHTPSPTLHPTVHRTALARWSGPLKEGRGMISTASGALAGVPYSFGTRFEATRGTNPEELLAGAHAACFAMAFAHELSQAGFVPDRLEVDAKMTMQKLEGNWSITGEHLKVRGIVARCDNDQFVQIAHHAKANCPVSRLLNVPITLEAELLWPPAPVRL